MKNMASRIAALEGRGGPTAPLFPIYIVAAGVPEERVVAITGAGLHVDRGSDETLEALKDRVRQSLGEEPRQPVILSYKYADTGDAVS